MRASLKTARAQLNPELRLYKAIQAGVQLSRHPLFRRARAVGLYVAVGAECPTLPLSVAAEAAGKALYYPVLLPSWMGRLAFAQADAATIWQTNIYGIPEPCTARPQTRIPVRHLDLLIMPLVGFDGRGNRLGMGAGYYDRCLEFRRHRRIWHRPLLIGLAFDCQQADKIPAQPWDVPLDGIVTESGVTLFDHGN